LEITKTQNNVLQFVGVDVGIKVLVLNITEYLFSQTRNNLGPGFPRVSQRGVWQRASGAAAIMPGERTKRKAPAGPEPSAQAQKGSRSRGDKGATATGVSAQSADKQWRQQYQKVQEAKRRRAENQEAVSPAAWQEVNATSIDQDSQSGTAIENTVVSRRSINHPVFLNRRWQRVRQVNADGTDGRPYWFDVHTGETSWVPPPPPQLNADGSVDLAQRPTPAAASGKRGHRKHLSAATVLRKWPKDGFFIGPNQELRCLYVVQELACCEYDVQRRN